MRRLAVLVLALAACAHVDSGPQLSAERPATFSEGTSAPVRKKCRKPGPVLGERDRASGRLVLDYLVTEEGRVKDVSVSGNANAGAVKAIRAFLASCTYQPAMQNGKPVAARWKGELRFPE